MKIHCQFFVDNELLVSYWFEHASLIVPETQLLKLIVIRGIQPLTYQINQVPPLAVLYNEFTSPVFNEIARNRQTLYMCRICPSTRTLSDTVLSKNGCDFSEVRN